MFGFSHRYRMFKCMTHIRPELLYLSNGIPVLLQHQEGPVAANYWWVRTGSTDELPSETGFAHFLEHMLFKDAAAKETGIPSTGQMARAIESLGGEINAYTSFDQTVYHVTCSEQHWENVLQIFGKMARPQRFLKTDFLREKEVILEELKKNLDSPDRQISQNLFSATYLKHPYGRPVIGYEKILRQSTVAQLESFYRKHYVSSNMGLILVGPYASESQARKKTLLKTLETLFGSRVIPKKTAQKSKRIFDSLTRSKPKLVQVPFDVKTPSLVFSFRTPEILHPDLPTLNICSDILGVGELSRLYKKLFYDRSLVTEASGGLYLTRDPGLMYFQFEFDSVDKVETLVEEVFKEFAFLRENPPTSQEMERVIASTESERSYATQTADGLAGRLGFLRFGVQNLNYDQEFLQSLKAASHEAISQACSEYLSDAHLSGVLMVPKEEKDKVQFEKIVGSKLNLVSQKTTKKVLKSSKKEKTESTSYRMDVQHWTRQSGIRVAYFHRPQSPVFGIHSCAIGGGRLELSEEDKNWGVSHLMALTWTKGSSKHSAQAISEKIEGVAASMEGFSGRHSVGLEMNGLVKDWDRLFPLFAEVLVEPTFPESEVEHSRRVTAENIRSMGDHSGQLCSKLFLETLFENHPYGRITIGSLESIAGIGSSQMTQIHRRWIHPQRLVVSVVGGVSRTQVDRLLDTLEEHFQKTQKAKTFQQLTESLDDEPALKAPRWIDKKLDRGQIHLLVGGLGTKLHAPDRYKIRVLNTLLGGQSGRLFIELREKKSLAYAVAPMNFEGLERGYVGAYMACSPEKKQQALEGIKKVFEETARKGPSLKEVKRAQQLYLGRRAMDLQGDLSLASFFGLKQLYGLPMSEESQIVKSIESVTPNDIRQVCEEYLIKPSLVTSLVS